LAGYFFSKDIDRIWRVAEALEVGMVNFFSFCFTIKTLIPKVGANTGAISQSCMSVPALLQSPETLLTLSDLSEESKNQDKVEKEVMKVWQNIWLLKSSRLDLLYQSRSWISEIGAIVERLAYMYVVEEEECKKRFGTISWRRWVGWQRAYTVCTICAIFTQICS
jgi:hypothetical protein